MVAQNVFLFNSSNQLNPYPDPVFQWISIYESHIVAKESRIMIYYYHFFFMDWYGSVWLVEVKIDCENSFYCLKSGKI